MAGSKDVNDLARKKKELLEKLRAERGLSTSRAPEIERRRDRARAPLSFAQERLWFLDQLEPGRATYNIHVALSVEGTFRIEALRAALEALIERHETLRTTVEPVDGVGTQVIHEHGEPAIRVVDVSSSPERERDGMAERAIAEEVSTPFDLRSGPLLRVLVVRLEERRHALALTIHHIVSDRWSLNVLVRDLVQSYHDAASGRAIALPELPIQYADFAEWQRRWIEGEALERQLDYWRKRLSGAPPVEVPTDHRRPAMFSYRGAEIDFVLDAELTNAVRALALDAGATHFAFFVAAFSTLLHRLAAQDDVVIGTPVANRRRTVLEGLIGFFANTLVLRSDFSGRPTFRDVLARAKQAVVEATEHQDVPFERVVHELSPERSLGRTPLFQHMLQFVEHMGGGSSAGDLRVRPFASRSTSSKFDLSLTIRDGVTFGGALEFSTDLYEEETARRLLDRFVLLLRRAVDAPDRPVDELPILLPAEIEQLASWNRTEATYSKCRVHEAIARQAGRTPDAIAVSYRGEQLSYRELDRRANGLAFRLRRGGVGPESRVGVFAERSLELPIALLAVLKAGAAYVPLDPDLPASRVAYVAESGGVAIVLSQRHLLGRVPEGVAHVFCIEDVVDDARDDAPPAPIADESLAYVIFTSGSTGKPKGAANTHGGLWNRLTWMQSAYAISSDDVVLQKTAFGFDVSVWEFFWPLATGARLTLATPGGHRDPAYLSECIQREGVSVVHFVPSMLQQWVEHEGVPACRTLEHVVCSGEALPGPLANRLRARSSAAVHNLYGPTEAAIDVSAHECTLDEAEGGVPIGGPIANTRIHVLDRELAPVPVSVAGEVYLGGVQLARGYVDRPDLTAERFLPAFDEPGARMYRTGDLGRWLPGGEVEYLGRADHQVKIRGFRIELGEIEAVLAAHDGVESAAVVVREDVPGDKRIVAYVVPRVKTGPRGDGEALGDDPIAADAHHASSDVALALRRHCAEQLPPYMVPHSFVELAVLPLTASGKLDRNGLPRPSARRADPGTGFEAPRTPTERQVASIWTGFLRVGPIGLRDNFFALGGDSILSIRVVARIEQELGIQIPLRAMFEAKTLAELVERVEEARRSGVPDLPPLVPAPPNAPLVASFGQERLWFLDQLEPGSPMYNVVGAVRLRGRIEYDAFARALAVLLQRHRVLRTGFANVDGKPVPVVHEVAEPPLEIVDASSLPAEERASAVERCGAELARRSFDLTRPPLLRAVLVKRDDDEHVLVVSMHHIASDGWSLSVLVPELARSYEAIRRGQDLSLPPLPLEYADWARWQRSWLHGERLEAELRFWCDHLAGAPAALELPTDQPRPAVQSFRGDRVRFAIPAEIVEAAGRLARSEGATLFMAMLAAWQLVLARYSGQADVVVGTPVANRTHAKLESLVGFFVNTLALRTRFEPIRTFRDLLRVVRETTLAAYAHQHVPFEEVVRRLSPARDLSRSPVFQVMFVLQNAPAVTLDLPGLRIEPFEAESRTSKYDLLLDLSEGSTDMTGSLEYCSDLFEPATIRRLAERYVRVLSDVLRAPDESMTDLPLLLDEERERLQAWNATAAPELLVDVTLDAAIEQQVARTPHGTAAVHDAVNLTYEELDRRANRLAWRLRELGVGPDVLVGIRLPRSTDLLVAVLATSKAGGAYVPLDPSYPAERLSYMLEDCGASVLLEANGAEPSMITGERVAVLDVAAVGADATLPDVAPPKLHGPWNRAYVIYTSGSTGRPKGVEVTHGNVMSFLGAMRERLRVGPHDLMLAVTSLSFDIAALELYLPLVLGARVCVAPREVVADGAALLGALHREQATVMQATPSGWQLLLEAGTWETRRLRVLCGGEAMPPAVGARLLRQGAEVWNLYGPTETTIWSSAEHLRESDAITVGRPIANTQLYVLDERLAQRPIGARGELYIGGAGVARGYLGRAELTAERFVADPFGPPGARMYRTGDVARQLSDGRVVCLGRADHQVKLRGFRIELGEIEAVLARHPLVREAVVVVRAERGDPRLVGYYTTCDGAAAPSHSELREHLGAVLPEYMVPAVFMQLETVPRTPNGKVDRNALPQPALVEASARFVPPRTPLEVEVCAVIGEVLSRAAPVGVHDDFFELGGHSLLAMQLVARLTRTLGVELPLRAVFEAPTVATLVERIEAARAGLVVSRDLPPLEPAPPDERLVPSFGQERLWFLDQLAPGSPMYNVVGAARLRGAIQHDVFARALGLLLERHGVLRTGFSSVDGELRLEVRPVTEAPLEVVDLSSLPQGERARAAQREAARFAMRPFDLSRPPLLRALLIQLDEHERALVLSVHHIASDGWSLSVLVPELAAAYQAMIRGEAPPLRPLRVEYADWARWQRSWLRGERLDAELRFWIEHLAGAPAALDLPTDEPRPAIQSFRGARHAFALRADLVDGAKRLAQSERATLFMILLAAWKLLLFRYSGQDDVVVGTPIANRALPDLEPVVGFFVNTLALRTRLDGASSFRELLRAVRETTLAAYAHQHLPFDELVRHVAPERDLSRTPVFQVMFALQNVPALRLDLGDLQIEPFEAETSTAKFDLAVSLSEQPDGAHGSIEYCVDLFDADTIRRLAARYELVLRRAIAQPDDGVGELSLLLDEERERLVPWNRTEAPYPDAPVHELVAERARSAPDSIAISSRDEQITYSELDRRSNQVARALAANGVRRGDRVGLCLHRSSMAPIAILAVLKLGAAYVPLDPTYPAERLRYIIDDCAPRVVVADGHLVEGVTGRIQAQHLVHDAALEPDAPLRRCVTPDDPAYVIYTSGSTGRPKGAVLVHRGLSNLISASTRDFAVAPGTRILQVSAFGFDMSVWETFLALVSGATLVLESRDDLLPGEALRSVLRTHEIGWLLLPPTVLAATPSDRLPALRTVISGGEACTGDLARAWGVGRRFVNGYGPTEITVCATMYDADPTEATPPIGAPLPNVQAHVLDARLRQVPIGFPGELCIGGVGVASGYLGRPELTAERFVPDPFGGHGARVYRTGDRTRRRGDGALEFLGRVDQQIKLRGFRIELGEIEAVLSGRPDVRQAVVALREDHGNKRLVAYYVPADGAAPNVSDLREHLGRVLPDYMVPAAFVALDAIPLTPHGKIDRRALPAPSEERPDLGAPYEAPRTEIERTLESIWASVLRVDRVGVHDDFFALGGDSILSIQVVARAAREGIGILVRSIFEQRTLRRLAAVATARRPVDAEPGLVLGELPLTPVQRWFVERYGALGHFNQALLLEPEERLDPARLGRALAAVASHHDMLRWRLRCHEGVWSGEIVEESGLELERVDLGGLPEGERRSAVERRAAEAQASLDVENGPVLRAVLFELGASERQRLLFVAHHLVIDGVSWRILLDDLWRAYAELHGSETVQLGAKGSSYKAWAERLRAHARSEAITAESTHWGELASTPVERIPLDRPGGRNVMSSARTVTVRVDSERTQALLERVHGAYGTEVDDVLLTALWRSYSRWTGRERLLVDREGHGREELFQDVDVTRTIGWFTAIHPVLLEAAPDDPIGEQLVGIKERLRSVPGGGVGHGVLRYLGDGEIAARLRSGVPADVLFNYLGQVDRALGEEVPLRLAPESVGRTVSPLAERSHAVEVNASILGGRLQATFTYSEDLHERATVERWAEGFLRALEELVQHCTEPGAGRSTPSDFLPAARLTDATLAAVLAEVGLPKNARVERIHPLSPLQGGILVDALRAEGEGLYVTQVQCRMADLDRDAFRRAWEVVIRRHSVLRTAFAWRSTDVPLQVVTPEASLPWEDLDWSGLSGPQQDEALSRLLADDRRRSLDLSRAPLMRVTTARLAEREHVLLWSSHHVILDGWSLSALVRDLFVTYDALRRGEDVRLPGVADYGDYLAWVASRPLGDAERFWRERLGGFEGASSFDLPRPAEPARPGFGVLRAELDESLTAELLAAARTHGLTPNTIARGAWALLLARYGGASEVLFGTVVSGRSAPIPGIESMVGMLVNTIPARIVAPDRDDVLSEWLVRVQEADSSVRDWEHVPLPRILRAAGFATTPFDSIFVFENYPVEASLAEAPITQPRTIERTGHPLGLLVAVGRRASLQLTFESDKVDERAAARLLEHYRALLERIVRTPRARARDVQLVPSADEAKRLVRALEPEPPRAFEPAHRVFERHAARRPFAVAIEGDEGAVSYAELNARANRMARGLARRGARRGDVVGFCLEPNADAIAVVLAIAKIGAGYMPLDPTHPDERLAATIEDAAPVLVVAPAAQRERLARATIVTPSELDGDLFDRAPEDDLVADVGPDDLAYVIYTSGSTGRPKGVAVTHAGLANLAAWQVEEAGLSEGDRVSQIMRLGFDASTLEIWPSLTAGAALLIAPAGPRTSPADLCRWLASRAITFASMPAPLLEALLDEEIDALALRLVVSGGDQLRRGLPERARFRLVNQYGPTECAVTSTYATVGRGAPPIGRAITGVELYVVDEHHELGPIGVPGELWIGGRGVARGYLGRPDLTAERFVPDPFATRAGARAYRSGDRVRRRDDLELEFLGRIDQQVKIRGFRIEVREIEIALAAHPAISAAVVVARGAGTDKRLVAYWVPATDADAGAPALRAHLRSRIPDYMIPAAFVRLPALPLTPNGKLDRNALPEPEGEPEDYVAPRSGTEEVLSSIFAELLRREIVGVHDDFFELGGHSLLATQLVSRLRRVLGVDVPLSAVFEAPTVARLAPRISAALESGAGLHAPPLEPGDRGDEVPLSFGQERMWILHRLAPESAAYNMVAAVRALGALDVDAMIAAIDDVVARHDVVRTIVRDRDGAPSGHVLPAAPVERRFVEVGEGEGEGGRELTLRAEVRAEVERPFDLGRGPLLRVAVFRISERDHAVVVTMHHVAADGWSMGVLVREIAACYAARREGRAPALPPLRIRYADYARWQRARLSGADWERQLAFWRRRLAGAPPELALPTDRQRPAIPTHASGVERVTISPDLASRLRRWCIQENATTFMGLLAAFDVLLSRMSGQTDVVVGTPIANRSRAELEPLIGFFVNTLALRVDLSGGPTFKGLLARVRTAALEAYAHQDAPFDRIVQDLGVERRPGRSPIFQAVLALQNLPATALELDDLRLEPLEAAPAATKFDLALTFTETRDGISGQLEYASELFEPATARRIANGFVRVLEAALAAPERAIDEIDLLGDEDRRALEALAGDGGDVPDTTAHEAFAAQSRITPDAIAVVQGDEHVTYAELARRAGALARELVRRGHARGARIAVYAQRSIGSIVAVLAILEAGGVYVPLDPDYPVERLRYMVADAGVELVLSDVPLDDGFGPRLALDAVDAAADELRGTSSSGVGSWDPAYIIYTSGSTGRPKGAVLHHRGLCHLAREQARSFGVELGTRTLQFAALGFDASISEMFVSLIGGGTLVLASRAEMLPGAALRETLRTQAIEVVTLPPSALAAMTPEALWALRTVVSAGEACAPEIVESWGAGRRFLNAYGPTETTVCATVCECDVETRDVSIGRPLGAARVRVLDARGHQTPIGVPGELCVAGPGVAYGYVGRPELTAERFVPDPFGESGARLYRTGDLARFRADGALEFIGRIDQQVKVRGYRIELGEIEAVLQAHPSVRDAVVLARRHAGDLRLVAYVTARGDAPPAPPMLREELRTRLPEHMVPATYVVLETMPLSQSGKIDRKALPEPDWGTSAVAFVEPQSALERQLAAIWMEVLGVERVGMHDNFFDAGGHSLLLLRAQSKIRERLGVEVPAMELFRFPTIAALAAHLARPTGAVAADPERSRGKQQRQAVAAFAARARKGRNRG